MGIKKKKGSQQTCESSADGPEPKADSASHLDTKLPQKGRKHKQKKAASAEASTDCSVLESPNKLPVHKEHKVRFSTDGSGSVVAVESRPADAAVSAKQRKHDEIHRQGHRRGKVVVCDSRASADVDAMPDEPKIKRSRTAAATALAGSECEAAANGHVVAKTRKNKSEAHPSGSHSVANESKGSVRASRVTKTGSADRALAAGSEADEPATAHAAPGQADAAQQKQQQKKKKKDKKKAAVQEAETEKPTTSARDAALAYLDTWKRDRRSWSFQKVRQVWLLQHMYSAVDVDDVRFGVLLEYLEPLKGNARAETVRKAEEILAKADENDGTEANEGTPAPVDELKLLRAKEIVQHLSTE